MIAWLMTQKWFRWAAIAGAAVLAFLLMLAGARKQGEKLGKVKEQLRSKDVAEKVKQRIDEVPRPDKPDVVDKLRDGKF